MKLLLIEEQQMIESLAGYQVTRYGIKRKTKRHYLESLRLGLDLTDEEQYEMECDEAQSLRDEDFVHWLKSRID